MNVLEGKYTCSCGNKFAWRTYRLENNQAIFGKSEDMQMNVVNVTKTKGKYYIEIQCPKCNKRFVIEKI